MDTFYILNMNQKQLQYGGNLIDAELEQSTPQNTSQDVGIY